MDEARNTAESLPQLMTADEVAPIVRRSVGTVKQWVKLRKIPFVRVGGENLFDPDEIARWIESRKVSEVA